MNDITAAADAAYAAHKAGATADAIAEILAPVGLAAKIDGDHFTVVNTTTAHRPTLRDHIREAFARRLG